MGNAAELLKSHWKTAVLAALAVACPIAVGVATSLAKAPLGRPYISAREGSITFDKFCIQCHSVDPNVPSSLGPHLALIGRDAATRKPGMSAADYLLESIANPAAFEAGGSGRMPNVADKLTATQLRSLAAYLMGLSGPVDYEALAKADVDAMRPPESAEPPPVDLAASERGKQIFLGEGKCTQCHTLKRITNSGLIAPMVRSMAMHDEQYLRQSIEDPNKIISDTYKQYTVVTPEGVTHVGRIIRREPERITMLTLDSAGAMHPVVISLRNEDGSDAGVEITESSVSLMPKPQLTPEQINDLVTFLRSATDRSTGGELAFENN